MKTNNIFINFINNIFLFREKPVFFYYLKYIKKKEKDYHYLLWLKIKKSKDL